MQESIENIYKLIISNMSHKDEKNIIITPNTKLIEELGYDSVDLIQLIVDIEDEFGIDIANDELLSEKMNTPSDILELIKRVRGGMN